MQLDNDAVLTYFLVPVVFADKFRTLDQQAVSPVEILGLHDQVNVSHGAVRRLGIS